MSQPTDKSAVEQNAVESHRVLSQEVVVPAVFTKLAEFGFQPETDEEAHSLLKLGAALEQIELSRIHKQAADRSNMIKLATSAAFGDEQAKQDQLRLQHTVNELSKNENIRKAAMAVGLYELAQVSGQGE